MSKTVLTPFLLISFFSLIHAQDFKIKGRVSDSNSKKPLEAATIYAESVRDSTLIAYTISDRSGAFLLEGKTDLDKIDLYFSFNGYKTVSMNIKIKPDIDLGDIFMEEQALELKGVQVTGDRVPVRIRNDTLEFNANSFKTRPDASVEEVLKKLPGVEVDADSKITANGKEVDQVLVNGQIFFSKDPKVVTKSLPKEVIDKIQITNTKTKEQEFSGEEGSGESKTINLTIQKDKNKGVLGRLSAGYGTDERYEANGLLNYFDGEERISAIASSNNINNAGFSFDEIYGMMGRVRGINSNRQGGFSFDGLSFGFGKGITTSSNLGGSYANKRKGGFEVNTNYFFGASDSFNDEKTFRENILPTGSFFTASESSFEGTTTSHRGSAALEFDIDKTLKVVLEPLMSVNRTNSLEAGSTISSDDSNVLVNRTDTRATGDSFQRSFSNYAQMFKKTDTLGGYVRFSFSNTNNFNEDITHFRSSRELLGNEPGLELLDQRTTVLDKQDNYAVTLNYRKVMAKKLFFDLGYAYKNNESNNKRTVLDFDEASATYDSFNNDLSSDFDLVNEQHEPSLSLGRNGEKFRFRATAYHVGTKLNTIDRLRQTSFARKYSNVLFRAFGRYAMTKSKSIYMGYRTNLNVPSVYQLQPVANVRNPLNITIGNPDLDPSVDHRVSLSYNDYNWKERTGLTIYSGFTVQENQVVPITVTDDDFLRTTTYENVQGNQDGYMGMHYSKQFKKDSTYTLKATFNPYLNYRRDVGFNNGAELIARRWTINPRMTLNFNYRELLEIEPGYRLGLTRTKYNVDTLEDVRFTSHTAELKTTTYWPKGLIWGNDIGYTYNGNVGPGFDNDFLLWNMSLGMQMMKDKATLKLLAYDLLNQNNNTRRSTGADFIQDFQGTVLQRYFMLNFTYKFDQFGGKKSRNGRFGRF